MSSKFTSFAKKHTILTTLSSIAVALVGWWIIANFITYPLGDKMEYLGKKDFGNVLGFDTYPYSVYYYGTDMDEEELVGYFESNLEHPIEDKGAYTDIYLTKDGVGFYLAYEASSEFKTSKRHVVSISDEQYTIAKRFLD